MITFDRFPAPTHERPERRLCCWRCDHILTGQEEEDYHKSGRWQTGDPACASCVNELAVLREVN